jgi:hypothetical protein
MNIKILKVLQMELTIILFLSTQYSFVAKPLLSLHERTKLRGPPFRKLRSIRHNGHVITCIFPLFQKLNDVADVIIKGATTDWVILALNSPCTTPRIGTSQTRGQFSFLCCRFRVRTRPTSIFKLFVILPNAASKSTLTTDISVHIFPFHCPVISQIPTLYDGLSELLIKFSNKPQK